MADITKQPWAIVLAAGKGTRMNSELPKVLFPVCQRPMIEYVLESLRNSGVGRIIVVVGYRSDLVRQQLASWDNIEFVEQTEQLGTGHAVMMCRDVINSFDGPVIIVAGDSPMLQTDSVAHLIQQYRQNRSACLLGTLIHDNPTGLGRIVRNGDGKFTGIVEEKDCTEDQRKIREVNMSTYLVDCRMLLEALDELTDDNQQGEYYITDVPGILIDKGHDVQALPVLKPCEALSINTVEQLAIVEQEMISQNQAIDLT